MAEDDMSVAWKRARNAIDKLRHAQKRGVATWRQYFRDEKSQYKNQMWRFKTMIAEGQDVDALLAQYLVDKKCYLDDIIDGEYFTRELGASWVDATADEIHSMMDQFMV
jgi:hypothetical protein